MAKLPIDNDDNNDGDNGLGENLFDNLFDEKWHEKIQQTINLTMQKLDESGVDYDHLSIAKRIIDYNIEKTIAEALSSVKFPEALDFSTINYCEAFEEFHRVLGIFMNKKEKRAELDIYFGNNKVVEDLVLSLDSFISRTDKNIAIQYKFLSHQTLHCTFLKV